MRYILYFLILLEHTKYAGKYADSSICLKPLCVHSRKKQVYHGPKQSQTAEKPKPNLNNLHSEVYQ